MQLVLHIEFEEECWTDLGKAIASLKRKYLEKKVKFDRRVIRLDGLKVNYTLNIVVPEKGSTQEKREQARETSLLARSMEIP